MILVRQVVAVSHIVTRKRPEAAEEGHRLGRIKRDHVLLAGILRVGVGAADARKHRMLFHVHVHRMHPATTSVRHRPHFASATALRQSKRGGGVELQTVDDPLGFPAGRTATLQGERPLWQRGLVLGQIRHVAQVLGNYAHVRLRRIATDDDLHERDFVSRNDSRRIEVRLASIRHFQNVHQVEHITWRSRSAIQEFSEVNHDFSPFSRPDLEGIARNRLGQQSAFAGDLSKLMALLAIRDLVLSLRAGGSSGRAAHEHEFIDTRYRSAQEAEAIFPAVNIEHRESRSVYREDISHKAMVREVAVIELAPPLGM